MTSAGIVLAGGRSSRMGTPKAGLEWHGSTLLRRTVEVLAQAVDGPVLVVAAPGQGLPALPGGVRVVTDPEPAGRGPVVGLATGLRAAGELGAATAFCCATDLPFLHPAYVRRVLAALTGDDVDVALPHVGGHRQPLAAGYLTSLAPTLAAMSEAGELRLGALFPKVRTRELTPATLLADPDLARADPHLESVTNVNSPDDYAAARSRPRP
ncbi:molybdenum cofactor guanylyltransferase [Pseudonocardia acaciae]|uniref:molybdenum cofactor guanylyltransferase n=1 Tax=Pseudonocardia acaciae TaxID=551276 RepID=UPI00068766F5|nr:molybdenum cofactor guanylyltransferase [Pseudonocardia acaciae]